MPNEARAPIDTSVKVPSAVLAAAARADQIHKQAYTTTVEDAGDPPPPPPVADPNAPLVAPQPAPAAESVQPLVPPTPAPVEPPQPNEWENRYKAMKGRHDILFRENNDLKSRLTSVEQMMAEINSRPKEPVTPVSSLTPEERNTWGEDMLQIVSKQARDAIQPEIDALKNENNNLKNQLQNVTGHIVGNARDAMLGELTRQVPNWEALNHDQGFLDWLSLQDAYSGAIRQKLLTQAFEQNNTPRVIAFFKGYSAEAGIVSQPVTDGGTPLTREGNKPDLNQFAAPGRVRSAQAPNQGPQSDKPIITRAQIANFYAEVRAGKYSGREAEKADIEKMIFSANNEGRIR